MLNQFCDVNVEISPLTYGRLVVLASRAGFENVADFVNNFFGRWVSTPQSRRNELIARFGA